MPREHLLKVWPQFFGPVARNEKPFEVRLDDRGFKVGDTLILREWCPATGYSGRIVRRRVVFALRGEEWGLREGFVCMGLAQKPPYQAGADWGH